MISKSITEMKKNDRNSFNLLSALKKHEALLNEGKGHKGINQKKKKKGHKGNKENIYNDKI